MAIESKEVQARRRSVVKDDDGAVIKRGGIVGERVDGGVKRGGDRSAGLDEEIEAEMNGAALCEWITGVTEMRRGVKRARLVVTADANGGVRGAQKRLQLLREGRLREVRGIGREKRTGNAEVEGEGVPFVQVLWNEARGGGLILGEPVTEFGSVRDGGKAACGAERVMRESRMNFGKALESSPRGSFGNRDVGIARDERFAVRGVGDADGEARSQEGKERGDFFFAERTDVVIGGKDGGGSGERIVVAEDGVGGGDGGFSDGDGLLHVAEINHREDLAGLRPGRRDESVVVVGITVDDAATKVRDARQGFAFEEVEKLGGEGATLGVFDVREKFAGPEGTGEIPFQIAFAERVGEIEERGIDFGEETAEAFEEFDGMRIDLSQDGAGQECEEPDKARGCVGELSLNEEFAIESGMDAGKRKTGSAQGEVSESAALHINEGAFASGMHDLQDKLAGIGRHEVKVVVVFAREWMRGGVDAVEGKSQARGFLRGDWRSDTSLGHNHGEIVSREWVRRQMRRRAESTLGRMKVIG
jgi:hypothetical protein